MALSRTRRDSGMNYWPGFVDALSTLILSIIFLLTVFMVAQFFLSQEVAGKDTALARLNAQISRLSDLLSLERTGKTSLEDEIAQLRASLSAAQGERDRLRGAAGAPRTQRRQRQGADRQAFLAGRRREAGDRARGRADRNPQSADRRAAPPDRRRSKTRSALPRRKEKASQLRIADLGQRLNVALAQRVQELSRYRSDFFGKLREILGNRPDIRVVGDRFVFQSEVFFDSGAAVLRPEGRAELDKLAAALLGSGQANSVGDQLGAARRRPYRHQAVDRDFAVQVQLGSLRRARHFGGAIFDQQGRFAAAPRRRRLRRIPADRSGHDR